MIELVQQVLYFILHHISHITKIEGDTISYDKPFSITFTFDLSKNREEENG